MIVRTFLLFAAVALTAAAQSGTGVIFGTITDVSGSTVAAVSVTAANEATAVSTTVKSNEEGYYLLPDLPPGRYKVSAEAPGFRTMERTGIVLEVDQRARVDVAMQL
ncbi:MAG: carboxypeptidase regulatory-like domain-containing protein, partial [Acidobacteriaceae bacterium]|nr:carboxypeptidase regulatory-like domain-containing protein [Acidobacteriaceae bacterium]